MNSFYEDEATIEYSVNDIKRFDYIYEYSNVTRIEDLKKFTDFNYEVIKLSDAKNLVNKKKHKLKKQENEELEGILNFELSNIPNIICLLCSRIYNDIDGKVIILRYFLNIMKYDDYMFKCHKSCFNKENYIHIKNFKRNYGLVSKKHIKANLLFLIGRNFIKENYSTFIDFEESITSYKYKNTNKEEENNNDILKINNNNLNNLNLDNNNLIKLKEMEIEINFVEKIDANYFKYLDKDLQVDPKEFFSKEEIVKCNIVFVEDNIEKYVFGKNYKKYQFFNIFICYDCSFIDKYGNPGWRIFKKRYAFKRHADAHFGMIKNNSILSISFPDEYVIVNTTKYNSTNFAVKNESIELFNKEKEKPNNNIVNKYGNKIKIKPGSNIIKIIGWNSLSVTSSHNSFLLNNFLENNKPDFLLLNEVGFVNNDFKEKLHEDYNIISPSRAIGIIYKRIFKLKKILTNLSMIMY